MNKAGLGKRLMLLWNVTCLPRWRTQLRNGVAVTSQYMLLVSSSSHQITEL